MNTDLVRQIQQLLVDRGHNLGNGGPARNGVDGQLGDLSLQPIYQELLALTVTQAPAGKQQRRLAWGLKVSAEFREGVYWIAEQMGWPADSAPSELMSCMAWESAETFSSSVKNAAGSGATGLIQFMPTTARALGTTVEELAQMTPVRQLGYVYLYFKGFPKIHGPHVTLADMYMAILMPKYIGEPDTAVLFSDGIAYRQNSGLDVNRDGRVTKLEAAGKVYQKLARGNLPEFLWIGQ